jgi:hypothetical protein
VTFLKRQKEARRREKREEKRRRHLERKQQQQPKKDSLPSGEDVVQIQTKEQLKEQEQL